MDPADLERVAHVELRRLPLPRAPRTLAPRVMTVVRRRSAPWYTRAWRAWPLGWRMATAGASVALLWLLGAAAPSMLLGELSQTVAESEPMIGAAALAGQMETVAGAAWILWRYLVQPVLPFVLVFSLVMYAACAAFGLALSHIAFGRTTS